MNLLKQPPLAGSSGSARLREVRAKDQREEEQAEKNNRLKKHKHQGEKSASCSS